MITRAKAFLKEFGKIYKLELHDGKITHHGKSVVASEVTTLINAFTKEQVFILYHRFLAKHKTSITRLCIDLHMCPAKFYIEQRAALDKFTLYFSRETME